MACGKCIYIAFKNTRYLKAFTDSSSALAVDFESFQKVLNRPGGFRDPGEPEEYCRGFQVFDKDMTGFIGVGQLRYSELTAVSNALAFVSVRHMLTHIVLTNLGEKMSDEEVDELLKAVDTSSGEINYTGMITCLPSNKFLTIIRRSGPHHPSQLGNSSVSSILTAPFISCIFVLFGWRRFLAKFWVGKKGSR